MNLIYKISLSVGLLVAASNAIAQSDCGYWASQGYYSTNVYGSPAAGFTAVGSFQVRFQYVPTYCRRADHYTFSTSASGSGTWPTPAELARQERCR